MVCLSTEVSLFSAPPCVWLTVRVLSHCLRREGDCSRDVKKLCNNGGVTRQCLNRPSRRRLASSQTEHHHCLRFHALKCFPTAEFQRLRSRGSTTLLSRFMKCCTPMSCFQWRTTCSNGFARLNKATTALAPSTPNFQVFAPPE